MTPDPLAFPHEILYEDAHCLAVSKPAGVLTQGWQGGEPSLETAIRLHLASGAYLGTVHRLDRGVSGVVLWAKTPKAARRFAEQFEARSTRKEYRAIVAATRDDLTDDPWEDWLEDAPDASGVVKVCDFRARRAKFARTIVREVEAKELPSGRKMLAMFPETGRTHQLRVQAARRGIPILGDRAYGSEVEFGPGIALHARSLTVRHPAMGRDLCIEANYPDSWRIAGFARQDKD